MRRSRGSFPRDAVLNMWQRLRVQPGVGHWGCVITTERIALGMVFVPECRTCRRVLVPPNVTGFLAPGDAMSAIKHHRWCVDPNCICGRLGARDIRSVP
jgi:hypothetical protein